MTENLLKLLLEDGWYFSIKPEFRFFGNETKPVKLTCYLINRHRLEFGVINNFWEQFKKLDVNDQTKIIINSLLFNFIKLYDRQFEVYYRPNLHPDTLQAIKLLTL